MCRITFVEVFTFRSRNRVTNPWTQSHLRWAWNFRLDSNCLYDVIYGLNSMMSKANFRQHNIKRIFSSKQMRSWVWRFQRFIYESVVHWDIRIVEQNRTEQNLIDRQIYIRSAVHSVSTVVYTAMIEWHNGLLFMAHQLYDNVWSHNFLKNSFILRFIVGMWGN